MTQRLIGLLLLLLAGCGGEPAVVARSEVGPAGGTVAVTDPASPFFGTAVEIPAGALAAPATITIRNVTGAGLPAQLFQFEFGPDGLVFALPVRVTIKYGQSFLTDFGITDTSGLAVVSSDALGGVGILQTVSVDAANRTVTATATHFSRFAVDALKNALSFLGGDTHRIFFQPRLLAAEVHVDNRFGNELVVSGAGPDAELRTVGKGSPADFWETPDNLILVHGLTSDARAFGGIEDLVEALRPFFDNILVYQYPSGRSISSNANWLYNQIVANANPASFETSIIGHSMGGMVARYFREKSATDPARMALANYDPAAVTPLDGLISNLVTIGTPNRGAAIIELAAFLFSGVSDDFLALALSIAGISDLQNGAGGVASVLNPGFVDPPGTDYYLIAGKVCFLSIACLTTDGLVEVESATGDPELLTRLVAPSTVRIFPDSPSSPFDYSHRALHNQALTNGVAAQILDWFGLQ